MRLSRIAITLLVVALVAAFAVPGALACDKTKAAKAETAKAETASAEVAGTSGCASKATAETASTKTASTGACSSTAAAATKTASTGACSSTAAAATKTASAGSCDSKTAAASTTTVAGAGCSTKSATTTAGAGCSSKSASAAKYDIAVETVKMPSGALAVMYVGNDATSVAALHSAANGTAADFMCSNVQKMAATENCKVEMAAIENGIMFLCTSEDQELIESFAKNYEVAQVTDEEQGE